MAQADSVPSAVRVLITGTGAKPSTSPFRSGHEIIAGRERQPAGSIYLHPYPIRFKDGADCLALVLSALSPYSATLDETAQNVRNGRDIRKIEATLLKVTSDPVATSQRAVEAAVRRAA
jgi:hypothetical protein